MVLISCVTLIFVVSIKTTKYFLDETCLDAVRGLI